MVDGMVKAEFNKLLAYNQVQKKLSRLLVVQIFIIIAKIPVSFGSIGCGAIESAEFVKRDLQGPTYRRAVPTSYV